MKPLKVLFITGSGRSGSTLLSNILGQVDGVFSAGEVRYIWDRGIEANSACGCGEAFCDCTVWPSVLESAFGRAKPNPAEMVALRQKVRNFHLLQAVTASGRSRLAERLGDYPQQLGKLFAGMQQVTDSELIVDASKFPSHGFVLGQIPNVSLYVVHLIRDSRAVAYSWQRKRSYNARRAPSAVTMEQHNPIKSSFWWNTWNWEAEMLWKRQQPERYLQVQYENFIQNPASTIQSIFDFVGMQPAQLPITVAGEAEVGVNHSVSGNPNRFKQGKVALRLDTEWQHDIKRSQFALVTALTFLGLRRYRYPVLALS